ncbi:hypothetical protein [Actinacidiphila oryziradicis]|nr:hypothetical protein [Actinacidiphila oryziradicis]
MISAGDRGPQPAAGLGEAVDVLAALPGRIEFTADGTVVSFVVADAWMD